MGIYPMTIFTIISRLDYLINIQSLGQKSLLFILKSVKKELEGLNIVLAFFWESHAPHQLKDVGITMWFLHCDNKNTIPADSTKN